MSKSLRANRRRYPGAQGCAAEKPRHTWVGAIGAGLVLVAVFMVMAVGAERRPTTAATSGAAVQNVVAQVPPLVEVRKAASVPKTFDELLACPPDQLGQFDIALVNLVCAQGLPGSEDLDISKTLRMLDLWAAAVKGVTERHLPGFRKDPATYNNSEPFFRMLALLTVLQQDLSVKYNMQRVTDINFGNSKDQFIHGMVNSDNGGTCVSMPVLYVAIGRRLGYPMKLVLAHEHVLCRWDDGSGISVNFEGSSVGGNTYPDSRYREWPRAITDEEMKHREFLVSLTPAEELSVFLAARGHCLMAQDEMLEAKAMYERAAALFPSATQYRCVLADWERAMDPMEMMQRAYSGRKTLPGQQLLPPDPMDSVLRKMPQR